MTPADPPRKGLGKGLSALLGGGTTPATGAPATGGPRAASLIPIAQIEPGRIQPRRVFDPDEIAALADSIRAQGVLQPILVRRASSEPPRYEIIAGERRWRAAQAAQLHDIPAVVKDLSDREALEAALVENIQRQDLSPLEEAEGYKRLVDDFGHTQDAIGQALGKSRAHIANTIRLLALPQPVKEMLARGELDAGHARVLITATDPVALARRIVAEGLTVRQAEALAREAKQAPKKVKLPGGGDTLRDADTRSMEKRLEEATGLKVSLAHKRGSDAGSVTFHYSTLDQFDALLARLTGG
ncbi:MAG: ParB/RepB/Spo0J family partition protein [Alphaproteobacteria bacterium]|nr:ParB/RepB/Spo0J family partition protein [Alphaproteobacteria bacterium]